MVQERVVNIILAVCMCPQAVAPQIAREVLEQRCAACVDILPGMWGMVGWEPGQLSGDEVTLLITTADDLVEELYTVILELHPASKPVIANLELAESYSAYIEWLHTTLAGD